MKSKLFTIFAILLLSTLFTACSEEEIRPNDGLNQTTETVSNGVTKDDKGF
ncbi:MAG: hypothetical protein RLO12_02380 [Fulvivirga sp.]|jgi:hypothetical protein|uniref:hypothetical protein n=1 Tax=Fulvivirga sp. TaxID=1931237 RepID=UPI0032EC021F